MAFLSHNSANANDISVSTKPLHSLVASITGKNASPVLIIDGFTTIHNTSLKPSIIRKLHGAKIVLWMGKEIEPYIEKSLKALPDTTVIHDVSSHLVTKNVYWWTNPQQAIALIMPLSKLIITADPENKSDYQKNAENLIRQLKTMSSEIKTSLAPFSDTRFLTQHDTYRGFNSSFGLTGGKAIERNGAVGAKTIAKLRNELKHQDISCVFGETGENSAILTALLEGTKTRIGTLDAMGNSLAAGSVFYETLIRQIADAYLTCFRAK